MTAPATPRATRWRTVLEQWFLPRDLHPGAWWIWALGLAVAASRTTNPWLLTAIVLVACHVVMARRSSAPWAKAFGLYLWLGGLIVVMRVAFRILLGGGEGGTNVLRLPEVPLPAWAAGIRLLGDVSAESLLGGLYDGMRLAAMVICLGAANALANPKRLLKAMPPALYEVGTAVVVAISVFPQLAESVQRVHRARRLRGSDHGRMRVLHTVVIPVLEDAFERSLALAASMDSRGYGRAGHATARARFITGALMLGGLTGVCVGVYATLDGTTPRILAGPVLLAGVALALLGFTAAGRRVHRTRYRPDRWLGPEVVTAAVGITTAAVLFATSAVDPTNLHPSLAHLTWPAVSWLPLAGILLALLPAVATPAPEPPPSLMDDDPSEFQETRTPEQIP